MATPVPTACPCDSSLPYARCCGPLHAGAPALDAKALMRSRYSAYVLGDADYLRASWHASTRPAELSLADAPGQRTTWLGLKVESHTVTGEDTAEVVFTARLRVGGGSAQRMHEHSRFMREDGHWFYLDGEVR
ncbi:YchJ family metal-binding protein [Pseudoxanthomonas sp.]|uniref:YchJ family protein n=1 Tax=Pseudoxanthomonas sp. TaxID=1871049 RepID=UPI00261E54D8|nr:YchJ family metal-binding protein [Pseudoxanthomonas sp.]WDS35002.1 MAG: YchJ family metal-binding protein [Pseudoxanthomonas sp.]